ncbi:MAG: DNA mismatch repair protein MutS, partial [Clostridia bacterium]|nr:DNA mismatch repair protein MutS [Clostridia bacterium]
FMVEMQEVANIINNASENSLIILDEVGRGTSTADGLSIARAVTEYIHDVVGARTLFATHYHELVSLEGELAAVKNYCVAVLEKGEDIVFLRTIKPGSSDKSYGLQVARLAGLPPSLLNKAREYLEQSPKMMPLQQTKKEPKTTQFSSAEKQVLQELNNFNLMAATPLEAMERIYHWQLMLKQGPRVVKKSG